jgi:GDP-4-dehydro-6-deoxy-D-mannose reductase
MRAVVTGAGGFVGPYLVGELLSAGYEVLATDVVDEEPGRFPSPVHYQRCDLLDGKAVGEMLARFRPERIFHLAAQSSAARSFEDPRGTLETNLFAALNILEGAKELNSSSDRAVRLLSVGSSEEYGRQPREKMPLTESSPVEPVSPYAVSKAAQALLFQQYRRAYGFEAVLTRSFSHTGPGQTVRFVLPSFARQCAEIGAGIGGPVMRVGNLDVIRDFLDVRDVARAYRLLAEAGADGAVYNVCSGKGLALRAALDILIARIGGGVTVETDPELLRPADVPLLLGDNGLLRADTGWEQTISHEQMLSDLAEYWEQMVKGAHKK